MSEHDNNEEKATEPAPSFLHPASGGLILGADWLLFSGTVATGGMSMLLAVPVGFLIGTIGVTSAQHYLAKESWGKSFGKGLLAGLAVGAPLPIGGTIVGGAVLASSGLHQLRDRAAKALLEGKKGDERE